jgi:hypothetical protein
MQSNVLPTPLEKFFPEDQLHGLRLEEVTLTDDERNWLVTISYKNPDLDADLAAHQAEKKGLAAIMGRPTSPVPTRHFKTIKLKAEDGALVGIRSEWNAGS